VRLTDGDSDVGRFRAAVALRLGLDFNESKLAFLSDVLRRRLDACGDAPAPYLDRMESPRVQVEELRALAKELTVTETYFFRHAEQLRAFVEVALPDRLTAGPPARQMRVLSAGCASGEEPYSLAILARDGGLKPVWNVSIRAVDMNPAMLEKAALGCFSTWSLRETPPEIRLRWFTPRGREFILDRAIRDAVTFELRNLSQVDPVLWEPETYDVVFCRNMMMYFTAENMQALIARATQALVPGGYLFLGHAETLRGLSQDFHLRNTNGTFYYQRKGTLQRVRSIAPTAKSVWSESTSLPAAEGWATTWIETVQHMSRRVQALTEAPLPADAPAPAETSSRADLCLALELLRTEHFEEALVLLGALPLHSALDPDVLLLRAVLLTHGGKIAAASKVCAQLLQLDEFNPGAHYVLALCREGEGDQKGALQHDQLAAYLDPTFAMPHLHLGLLARRGGDAEMARRELREAFHLLKQEDASRLLLFGGGFSRDALVALCSRELDQLERKQ
jgi:chemotaxis protein methyltransferase CheR